MVAAGRECVAGADRATIINKRLWLSLITLVVQPALRRHPQIIPARPLPLEHHPYTVRQRLQLHTLRGIQSTTMLRFPVPPVRLVPVFAGSSSRRFLAGSRQMLRKRGYTLQLHLA